MSNKCFDQAAILKDCFLMDEHHQQLMLESEVLSNKLETTRFAFLLFGINYLISV